MSAYFFNSVVWGPISSLKMVPKTGSFLLDLLRSRPAGRWLSNQKFTNDTHNLWLRTRLTSSVAGFLQVLGHNFIVSSTYRARRVEMYGLNSPSPSFFKGFLRLSSQVYRLGMCPRDDHRAPGGETWSRFESESKVSQKVDQNLREASRCSGLSMYQTIPLLQNLLLREGLVKGWQECWNMIRQSREPPKKRIKNAESSFTLNSGPK